MAEVHIVDWDAVRDAHPEPSREQVSDLRNTVLVRIVRPARRVPDMFRLRRALWAAVLEILAGEEPVMVYGPSGRAKLVPRRVAEQLHAEHKLRIAKSVADAHEKLGVPSVGIEASEEDAAWMEEASLDGVERGVMEVPPRHLGTWATAGAAPLTADRIQEMADAMRAQPPPTLATWTCEVCKHVHPVDNCGLMLFACGGMLCMGCERRWPEHQEACEACRNYVPPPADLTDTED